MTNNQYGDQQVDSTFPMRNGIVKYLMSIHGIIDKYFNYNNINTFLHRSCKAYAKKIMCDPESVSIEDLDSYTILKPEEKAHICIIVMETKKRVELIYFTKMLS